MTILWLIIGLAILLAGSNLLVDTSVVIARKLGVSDFVIGATIVGVGTSAPELYVSVCSALQGMGDVAIGNVLGSNICNTLLILGATAVVLPIPFTRSNLRYDVTANIGASILLVVISYGTMYLLGTTNSTVNRFGGAILILCLIFYLWHTFKNEKSSNNNVEQGADGWLSRIPFWCVCVLALLALTTLIGGGNLFLNSAVTLAHDIGISEFAISVTVIAVGTSLPELTTCVIAAMRGNTALALGNILGSNLFNILFILGVSSVISPIEGAGVGVIDYSMFIGATLLVGLSAFTGKKSQIDRWEGAVAIVLYFAYTIILLYRGS